MLVQRLARTYQRYASPLTSKPFSQFFETINEHFIHAEVSSEFELINVESVVTKCILMHIDKEIVVTPCVDLREHD